MKPTKPTKRGASSIASQRLVPPASRLDAVKRSVGRPKKNTNVERLQLQKQQTAEARKSEVVNVRWSASQRERIESWIVELATDASTVRGADSKVSTIGETKLVRAWIALAEAQRIASLPAHSERIVAIRRDNGEHYSNALELLKPQSALYLLSGAADVGSAAAHITTYRLGQPWANYWEKLYSLAKADEETLSKTAFMKRLMRDFNQFLVASKSFEFKIHLADDTQELSLFEVIGLRACRYENELSV
jgi:hypothetical protein